MNTIRFTPKRVTAAACLLLACAPLMAAEAVAPAVPNAGSLLREVPPAPAAPPQAAPSPAPATIQPADTGPAFEVKQLVFKGNSAVPTEALQALAGDALGPRVTLARIQAAADRMTAQYRAQGYPLSRVVVPQQDITQGVLTLEVIEARLSQVVFDNKGRMDTAVLSRLSRPLQAGAAITDKALDRALLLMSDVPGTRIGATIRPGQEVGTSDIVITNAEGPVTTAQVSLDNEGNRYTGRIRALGQLQVFNPLRQGDVLGLTALSSGHNMNYGRVSYEIPVGSVGATVGGALSLLDYKLGAELAELDGHGAAGTGSAWLHLPFVRSHRWNVQGQAQFDANRLSDQVDSTQIKQDRHIDVYALGLSGDALDSGLQGGSTSWGVNMGLGSVAFNNVNAGLNDAASAQVSGAFTKWSWSLNHVHYLDDKFSVLASVSGQQGSHNLDSSQKLGLGGTGAVRAYRPAVVSGDSGYLARVELRYALPLPAACGHAQLTAFWDLGHVQVNKRPWAAVTGDNGATLSGLGLGARWTGGDQWGADLSVAAPTGPKSSLVKDARSAVVWARVSKGF